MSDAGVWPGPFEIEAIDPYPFHGLVYSEAGQTWLQPSGARPPVPLPPRGQPTPSPGPPYGQPLMSPALWDVGRPDPPFSEALDAVGGQSLGRRLVPAYDGLTMTSTGPRLLVLRHGDGNTLLLREETRTGLVVSTLAEADLPVSEMTSGISELTNPYNGQAIPVRTSFGDFGSVSALDRSADGTVRLLEYSQVYEVGLRSHRFIVAILQVEIAEDVAGSFTLNISVAANLAECIGTITYSRDSNMGWYSVSDGDTTPIDPMDQVWLGVSTGNASVAVGSFSEEYSMMGVIIGAYLVGRSARFFRASMTQRVDRSNDSGGSYVLRDSSNNLIATNWSLTKSDSVTESISLSGGGSAVTVSYEYTTTSSTSMLQSDVVHNGDRIFVGTYEATTDASMTGLPAYHFEHDEVVDARSPESIGVTAALQGCALRAPAGWTPSHRIAPRSIQIGQIGSYPEQFAMAEPGDTRCFSTVGLIIYERDEVTVQPMPRRVSPVLSPAGRTGEMADTATGAGTYPATALYNPMTGEVARSADHPGKSLQGWI